jgi:pyrroline-5-carboxylate reductase
MDLDFISGRGLVLLGCGKMGTAMLEGWLDAGLAPSDFTVLDPAPSSKLEALAEKGLALNSPLPADAAVAVLAVKPQMMGEALPALREVVGGGRTLFVSVAAGTPIARFEKTFGSNTPIVRAMPNTPAAIKRGVTALVGNAAAGDTGLDRAEALMRAVGRTVRLDDEGLMDAVTAVSGSGPAYVFLLIETLAAAGEAEGLAPALALELARVTVAGAGELAARSDEAPDQLRVNVTSPGGTTAAALEILMDGADGLGPLMRRAVSAAAARGRELRR